MFAFAAVKHVTPFPCPPLNGGNVLPVNTGVNHFEVIVGAIVYNIHTPLLKPTATMVLLMAPAKPDVIPFGKGSLAAGVHADNVFAAHVQEYNVLDVGLEVPKM
jgi:hypothetical protein